MQFAFLGHSFFGQSILFGHWFTAYTADAVPMHIIAANNIAISLFIPMCFCLFYYSSSFANLVIVCLIPNTANCKTCHFIVFLAFFRRVL